MDKILSLDIFGSMIFESDAVEWLKLCKDKKKEWILRHTNQRNEDLINEFINNPNISKECKCMDCGKNKKDDISKGISEEVTAVTEPIEGAKHNRKDSPKRQGKSKK